MAGYLIEPSRQIPVVDTYDVIVAGGGVAGIAAALSARRAGAKRVLLIEREFALGGLATLGLVTIYLPLCDGMGHQVSFSLAEELLRLSVSRGAEVPISYVWQTDHTPAQRRTERFTCQFNAAVFAVLCEQKLLSEGVEILYGTSICGAAQRDGRLTAMITESKSGRQAYAADAFVDATGDADICHLAGERTVRFAQGNVLAAWYYAIENGALSLHTLGFCDIPENEKNSERPDLFAGVRRYGGLDVAEISRMMTESHRSALSDFLAKGDLSPARAITTLPALPQLRMTRRLCGTRDMRLADAFSPMADSVGLIGNWKHAGPVYEVPLAALCGKTPNLYAAGRCIAAEEDMWDVTRVIPCCAVTGEAAGAAAALGRDLPRIQDVLRARGVLLHAGDLND